MMLHFNGLRHQNIICTLRQEAQRKNIEPRNEDNPLNEDESINEGKPINEDGLIGEGGLKDEVTSKIN